MRGCPLGTSVDRWYPVAERATRATTDAWLLAEWPRSELEPVKYWLSSLPEDTELVELVRLGKMRWRIEHDYRALEDALGLDHFEGRTCQGWHRHVTGLAATPLSPCNG